jgi:hypothetical protein
MTVFEKFKSMNIDEFIEWLDKNGTTDYSPWVLWFDDNYCKKCEPEITYKEILGKEYECECAWCETHDNKCRFFPDVDYALDNKKTIKLWLESEV